MTYSILKDLNNARRNIGYCPQFDALFDELTARNHLNIYARLRGVPAAEVDAVSRNTNHIGPRSTVLKPRSLWINYRGPYRYLSPTLIPHDPDLTTMFMVYYQQACHSLVITTSFLSAIPLTIYR